MPECAKHHWYSDYPCRICYAENMRKMWLEQIAKAKSVIMARRVAKLMLEKGLWRNAPYYD